MDTFEESDVPADLQSADPAAAGVQGKSGLSSAQVEAAALREAILRREVALLTAEKRRLLKIAAQAQPGMSGHPSLVDELSPGAPTLASLRAEIERMRASLAAKDALIRALYSSTSWRLMAPVRAAARFLRGGAAPGAEAAIAATNIVGVGLPALVPPIPLAAPAFARAPVSRITAAPAGSLGEVVIISDHLPLFDRQSGGLRLKTLVGMVAKLGWRITFCSFLPEGCPDSLKPRTEQRRYEEVLRRAGVAEITYGLDGMRRALRELGEGVRLAFVSFPIVATEVIPILRTHCPWARVMFDTVDLHFVRIGREAALRNSPSLRAEAERLRALEFSCMRMADVTLTVTEAERRMLLDMLPDVVVETLPNVFEAPERTPSGPEGRAGMLFLGGFQHEPNVDAVLWFAREIWPLVRARAPEAEVCIVGAEVPAEIEALGAEPGITVLGYVDNLRPIFDKARMMVAPLRYGAGMKGKVGQAMISGLPVVATTIGAEGMSAEDGRHLLIADDPQGFAAHVLALLENDTLWQMLQEEGHALIEATLSERAVSAQVARLFHV
jgi:glycosyltransferase involved in cell wall biosynthesis/uncharacterized small protein (DUF1192 family)